MKKPKLSEIRDIARRFRYDNKEVTRLEIGEAARAIYDLLNLVSRMGKSLNWFVHLAHGVGKAGHEPEPREEEAAAEEARALLEELGQ